jgi:hypothetical protein
MSRKLWLSAVVLCILAAPAAFAGSYEGSLQGDSLWQSVPGVIGWSGECSGSRAAEFNVTLNWAGGQQSLESGEWTLTFTRMAADGSDDYVGALRGTMSGGVLALDEKGAIASITGATLRVVAGYGAYSGVGTGSGELTAVITTDPSPFRGTVSLNW